MKIRNLIVASFLLAPFYLSAATTTADRVKSLARSAAPIVLPALAVGGASAAYIACLSPNAYKDLLFKHTSRATYLHILEMSGVNLDNMCSDDSTVEAAAYCEVQSYHAKAAGMWVAALTALAAAVIKYGHYTYTQWRKSKTPAVPQA